MPKIILCLLLLTFFSLNLTAQTSAELLRELLDLQSPPPKVKIDENKRPESFYDDKNPPADDAPIEDLLDYWNAKANVFYFGDSKAPTPSVKTSLRLLDVVQETPYKFNNFIKILPLEKEITERVKLLYDLKLSSEDVSDSWRDEVKNWLKFNGDFYVDEIFAEAQNAKDHKEYSTVVKSAELTALAKIDWEKAAPLLEKLENDKTNPRTAVFAKTVFYEHALKEKDESQISKYRDELKALVENKNAPGSERDIAIEALTKTTDWQGFDDWYLSLFSDETLLFLKTDKYSISSPLETISSKNPDRWIPILVKLVGNKDRAVHNAAVQSLVNFERKDALEPLLPWLSNPNWADINWNPGGRITYMQIVANIDLPESVPGLVWIVENDENNVHWAARSLAKYKDPRAIPALKIALEKTPDENDRKEIINALIASGGLTDDEQIGALEFYAEFISKPENLEKLSNRNPYQDENPLPVLVSIGDFLSAQKTPGESFVRALFEHLKELRKSKPATAKKLLEIANKWQGKSVDAEILKRVADGNADVDTILTILARRTELRESVPLELSWLTTKSGLARAVGVAVYEDETQLASLVNQTDLETQIAALACARLLRIKLALAQVGVLLDSNNKLLALAAERYLESEDSPEARQMVLAKHQGEALILGARDSFNPAKKANFKNYSSVNFSNSVTPLDKLFSSVNGSYLYSDNYYEFNKEYDKAEEKLRTEILENKDLKEIYASGGHYLRVYKDKAIYTWQFDSAMYREKVLTKEELGAFYNYLAENKIDECQPVINCAGEMCGANQFVMLNRNGGRRVFSYGGFGVGWSINAIFWSLQKEDAKLHFGFEKYVSGLEVLLADSRFAPKAIWKNGDDFRVLIEDQVREREISDEIYKLDKLDDKNEDLSYEQRREIQWKRRAERQFEHFSWFEFKNGKLGEKADEPPEVPWLRDKTLFQSIRDLESNDSIWQSKSGNFEICAGSFGKGGLWKTSNIVAQKIREGNYKNPITTPDGKWVIVSKTDEDWSKPNYVVRVNLQTGKESKIKIPPAQNLYAVAFVKEHNKILIRSSDEDFDEKNLQYYLLEVETGAVEKVKGEFRPFKQQTMRSLQSNGKPHEFWAAINDGEATEIGLYNAKLFNFKSIIKLPQIALSSMNIWVDEKDGKIYFIYGDRFGQAGYLLSLPLPK